MENKKFNPKKPKKEALSVTVDENLVEMLREISKEYDCSFANSVNEVLLYFKDNFWDNHIKENKKEVNKG